MKYFFSVGEPSGDLHGANLIRALRARDPEAEFIGFGGPRMEAAGCRLTADLTRWAVMWFARVLTSLHQFWRLLCEADRTMRHQRPDAVILIDYPGFNWWIARRAKVHGIPVFYYGGPQMWAWAAWRIRKMRRLVKHVLCKLPFESDWYATRGCPALYVGHPYFDELHTRALDQAFVAEQRKSSAPLITILPGSRHQEVAANLNDFLSAAIHLQRRVPDVRFAVAAFNEAQAAMARQAIAARRLAIEVHVGRTAELIEAARACLACSGSVSLELLFHRRPSIIYYRIGRWPFRIQRFFRTVRFITLVNLLASENRFCKRGELYDPATDDVPFPEYLTCVDRSEQVAEDLSRWLLDEHAYERSLQQLEDLRIKYAVPGASERAAEYIHQHTFHVAPTPQTHYRIRPAA